jgi:hypothetical protein
VCFEGMGTGRIRCGQGREIKSEGACMADGGEEVWYVRAPARRGDEVGS